MNKSKKKDHDYILMSYGFDLVSSFDPLSCIASCGLFPVFELTLAAACNTSFVDQGASFPIQNKGHS
jgi:hypothetical protein